MIIKDGTGTGSTLKVNSENRLESEAIVRPLDQHLNEAHALVYSLPFDAIDPVAADDFFIYIKNTGSASLHITDIRIRSTVAGNVEVHHVIGTASFTADADLLNVNRLLGSANILTAIAKSDTDVTGLSSSGVVFYIPLNVTDQQEHLKTSAHVIVPPGQAMALAWDAATGALSGTISIYQRTI